MDTEPLQARGAVRINLTVDAWRRVPQLIERISTEMQRLGFAVGMSAEQDGVADCFSWGISARLLRGEWGPLRDVSQHSGRWGRGIRQVPSLRLPAIKRDTEFPAFDSESKMVGSESDVLVLLESTGGDRIRRAVEVLSQLPQVEVVRTSVGSSCLERDPFGNRDGVSNLQQLRATSPAVYDRHLFTDVPCRGTFAVVRDYDLVLDRFPDDEKVLSYRSSRSGREFNYRGAGQVIGRDRSTGLVVEAATGALVAPEPGERQVVLAGRCAHARKANPRGFGYSKFGDSVTVPDARILRRPFASMQDGRCEFTFVCFQADIVHSGFEFIHNEWLMSDFNGAPDPLLDPDSGLVEPFTVGYFFVSLDQDPYATLAMFEENS